MTASIDDVSLIKDRDTGQSRKFAFIRFTSVGHAIQFVEKNRNFDMDSYRVRVDYCKKNKQENEKEEWRCSKVRGGGGGLVFYDVLLFTFLLL